MPSLGSVIATATIVLAVACESVPGTVRVDDAGSSDAEVPSCQDCGVDALRLQVVVEDLREPVWAGAPPRDARLFVLERPGRIRIVRDGAVASEPFLTVDVAQRHAEQGLLGLAFHPNWPLDPRFYVNYTEAGTDDTVIAEYRVSADDPDKADPEEHRLLVLPQDNTSHNGGGIAFGPDRYLYIATGDDGHRERVQDPAYAVGKILRIDVDIRSGNQEVHVDGDGVPDYAIPADNPFAGGGGGAMPEVAAWGLRNPWRFSFDRDTENLYLADVGNKLREEINVVPLDSVRGANFGWPIREATLCFNEADPFDTTYGPCEVPGFEVLPVLEYTRKPSAAVIGGFVYRGAALLDIAGTYFYSDNSRNFFRTLRWNGGRVDGPVDITESLTSTYSPTFVTSFGEDADGEIYVVTYAENLSGVVAKIVGE